MTVDPAALEAELAAFKDPKLARGLVDSIQKLAPAGGVTLMEVCGTHTMAIARNGIRNLMPEGTRLASGPGCPVCVTSNRDIDTVIALARTDNVTIATFGDMTRVPGSTSSLLKEQAAGRSVQIVYSPLDALRLAEQHPDREIVFVGVGFETTTPLVAMAIKRAAAAGLKNFSVFGAHKNMPGALEAIINDPQLKLDALILPGHVSTIIGAEPYKFLAETVRHPRRHHGLRAGGRAAGHRHDHAPAARGTRRDRDRLRARRHAPGQPRGDGRHRRGVRNGCTAALARPGRDPRLGLRASARSSTQFDAVTPLPTRRWSPRRTRKGCRCGDVLRGIMAPRRVPALPSQSARPRIPWAPAWCRARAAAPRTTGITRGSASRARGRRRPDRLTDPAAVSPISLFAWPESAGAPRSAP